MDLAAAATTFKPPTPADAATTELHKLCTARNATRNPEDKEQMSKKIWKFRRTLRSLRFRQRCQSAVQKGSTGPVSKRSQFHSVIAQQLHDPEGGVIPPDEWPQAIARYYLTLFASDERLPERVWRPHPEARPFDTQEIWLALQSQQINMHTAPSEDGVTPQLLATPPPWFLQLLADLATSLLQGPWTGEDDFGPTLIALIAKVLNPGTLKQFRPIALLPLLYRLVDRALLNRVQPALDARTSLHSFGCRKGGNRNKCCT